MNKMPIDEMDKSIEEISDFIGEHINYAMLTMQEGRRKDNFIHILKLAILLINGFDIGRGHEDGA